MEYRRHLPSQFPLAGEMLSNEKEEQPARSGGPEFLNSSVPQFLNSATSVARSEHV